ncbi:MAG TPA: hypothetical protein VGE35_02950 [Candidatus Paceibacterota bacterium]
MTKVARKSDQPLCEALDFGLLMRPFRQDEPVPWDIERLKVLCRGLQDFFEYSYAFGANPMSALRDRQMQGCWRHVPIGKGDSIGRITREGLFPGVNDFKPSNTAFMWAVNNGFVVFEHRFSNRPVFVASVSAVKREDWMRNDSVRNQVRMADLECIFAGSSGTFGFGYPEWVNV